MEMVLAKLVDTDVDGWRLWW